ncbi:MAG: protein-glutamate O-methyltransferase CheR, partial [Pedobacter sp.]
IEKRMIEKSFSDLREYIDMLYENEQEVKRLGEEFLINVTRFFRDKAAFKIMSDKVIPDIINSKADGDLLKVWVCACSTGEEAFSLAIIIDQCLQKLKRKLDVKIFATDIDENSLKLAQRGEFPGSIAKDLDSQVLNNYFVKSDKNYLVIPRIRKQIVFASHNVIKNPPFIKNDLVSCRNMMIYVNNILQQKLLATFHFSLMEGGYLFLGSSESAAFIKAGISEVSGKWKIYKKTSSEKFLTQEIYKNTQTRSVRKTESESVTAQPAPVNRPQSIEGDLQQLLLEELGYVGVYIDTEFNVKDTLGDFKKYLSLPEKKLNLNVLKMVPVQLSGVLSTAIRKAVKTQESVIVNKDIAKAEGIISSYRMVIKPLPEKNCLLSKINLRMA